MLIDQINTDITIAMKAKDALRLTTLRAIKVKIDATVKESGQALTPEKEQKLLESLVKQRLDSIAQFEKGNRLDLVAKESAELAIIKGYMPQDATAAEIDAALAEVMKVIPSGDVRQMGAIIKATTEALAGKRVDKGLLSSKVRFYTA